MEIFFYFIKGLGYSGRNTCVVSVSKVSKGIVCRCIDRNRLAECDVSQMCGDMYGAYCPMLYASREEIEQQIDNVERIKLIKFN